MITNSCARGAPTLKLKEPALSKEDRAEAREKIRQEKAAAAQEIREKNSSKALASRSVRKIVTAKFNVSFFVDWQGCEGLG